MLLSGDCLQAAGHQVDYLFQEDLLTVGSDRLRLRRFTIPLQVVRAIYDLKREGKTYDVVEIHEPIAAAYCLTHQRLGLPPVVVACYAAERRAQELWQTYWRSQGHRLSLRQRFGHLATVAWQADLALRCANQIKVESTEEAEYMTQRLKIPEDRLNIVHGGVSHEFRAACERLSGESRRSGILFVGTWIDRKGRREMVSAVARILKEFAATSVTFAGTRAGMELVRSFFASEFHGRISVIPQIESDTELAILFAQHHIFMLPSIVEGLPLALLEAATAGLAIISTRRCGMKDFIESGFNGLLIEPGDVQALVDALSRLLLDRALSRRLGQAARDKALKYTWERSASMYLDAFKSALRSIANEPTVAARGNSH
jgi:glycosyltransferase involved in cell wall biosynthesis